MPWFGDILHDSSKAHCLSRLLPGQEPLHCSTPPTCCPLATSGSSWWGRAERHQLPADIRHPGGDGGQGACQRQEASAFFASHLFVAGRTPTAGGAGHPEAEVQTRGQQQQWPPAILRAPGCGDARVRVVGNLPRAPGLPRSSLIFSGGRSLALLPFT